MRLSGPEGNVSVDIPPPQAIGAWIEWYNTSYLHSTLGYRRHARWNNIIYSAIALSLRSLDKWGALHLHSALG